MTATIGGTLVERWLPFPVQDSGVRLYCLPHAGGSASVYRSWIGQLSGVAMHPVQLPGRETRQRDTPHVDIDPLAAELAEVVLADAGEQPYAVYGHSLGAMVGFELLREIRRHGGRPPVHLLVSGCSAPQEITRDDDTAEDGSMTDLQIVTLLRGLGGTPELFLSDPRVLRMILPPIRADLMVKNSYRYRQEAPLDVPVTAIGSTDDPRASVESVAGWRAQTVRDFRSHTLPGGHFAVFEQLAATLGYIGEALKP